MSIISPTHKNRSVKKIIFQLPEASIFSYQKNPFPVVRLCKYSDFQKIYKFYMEKMATSSQPSTSSCVADAKKSSLIPKLPISRVNVTLTEPNVSPVHIFHNFVAIGNRIWLEFYVFGFKSSSRSLRTTSSQHSNRSARSTTCNEKVPKHSRYSSRPLQLQRRPL